MSSDLNSLPISITRSSAKFALVPNMREYFSRVLENLLPDEVIELTFSDEESRHRAHTSILTAAEKKWGRARIKTSNSSKNHTVRIWFNPVLPIPELEPLEQIQVPLEKLETFVIQSKGD